jgi:tetratricopeptide (TPR) repeat protein
MKSRFLLLTLFAFLLSPVWAIAEPAHDLVAQVDEEGLGLAESLLKQNRPDDAEELALRALKRDPESLEARMVMVKIAITRGDLEKAQTYVTQLMEADSTVPDHHALQGMVFLFKNRTDNAVRSLEKALELGQEKASPDQMASYANTLVLALHQGGEPGQALKVCVEALKDYPRDPDLYLTCSRLYREKGDFQAALEVAQQGLSSHPDFPGLYASVSLAQAGLGNKEASEAFYSQLMRRDPEMAKALRATLDGTRPDDAEYQVRTR